MVKPSPSWSGSGKLTPPLDSIIMVVQGDEDLSGVQKELNGGLTWDEVVPNEEN